MQLKEEHFQGNEKPVLCLSLKKDKYCKTEPSPSPSTSSASASDITPTTTAPLQTTPLDGLESPPVTTQPARCGLHNLGNTCYFNAVLQVLRYTPEFVRTLSDLNHKGSERQGEERIEKFDLSKHIMGTISEMEQAEQKENVPWVGCHVWPREVLDSIRTLCPLFVAGEQHDSHELLRMLLSFLQEARHKVLGTTAPRPLTTPIKVLKRAEKRRCFGPIEQLSKIPRLSESLTLDDESLSLKRGDCETPPCDTPPSCSTDIPRSPLSSPVSPPSTIYTPPLSPKQCKESAVDSGVGTGSDTDSEEIKELVKQPKQDIGSIDSLFHGRLVVETQCLFCEQVQQHREDFYDVSLPINCQAEGEDQFTGSRSISWGLSQYTATERLTGDNKVSCSNCVTKTEVERSTRFCQLPKVFTIQLKRFTMTGAKLFEPVDTPLRLCLRRWCSSECKDRTVGYSLYAVINHTGGGTGSGHYTSYVKQSYVDPSQDSNSWLHFDDETVTHISALQFSDILAGNQNSRQTPYVFFYSQE